MIANIAYALAVTIGLATLTIFAGIAVFGYVRYDYYKRFISGRR